MMMTPTTCIFCLDVAKNSHRGFIPRVSFALRVCVRARVRACVCTCVTSTSIHPYRDQYLLLNTRRKRQGGETSVPAPGGTGQQEGVQFLRPRPEKWSLVLALEEANL